MFDATQTLGCVWIKGSDTTPGDMLLEIQLAPPSWTTQEQLQSGITMASVNRIDSNFFVWLRVCLLYMVNNVPHAPCARGHVHVPFYEGTCPKKWKNLTSSIFVIEKN